MYNKFMFTLEQQKYLLNLARRTLEHYFQTGKKLVIDESELLDAGLTQKRGCFVTLHKRSFAKASARKNGELRGCIGHIEPIQPLYLDVIENALSAAFDDNRFAPVQQYELLEIDIEISVLTVPKKLAYFSVDDLLNKLQPLRDGVIIRKGLRGATYLPQVWEDLSDKEEFLSSLCLKAGLQSDEWRKGGLEVQVYQAEVFGEK